MENFDIKYLQNEGLHEVLAQGLADLFSKKPSNPVKYLENWLRNYNRLQKAKRQALQEKKNMSNIRFQIQQQFYEDLSLKKQRERDTVVERKKQKIFEERIENAYFVSDVLDSRFCDDTKKVNLLLLLII